MDWLNRILVFLFLSGKISQTDEWTPDCKEGACAGDSIEASVQRNGTSKEDEEEDKGVGSYGISLGMAEHQEHKDIQTPQNITPSKVKD